ncbi:hypothetical protein D9758_001888 [Tetrapyrgos nigripes]|uniref:C2H2-type domain-containing protein n=1 Tax=Tetrapyrgos nigripes TaxID=182062 RepID=A0A8H5GST5_9AGAR|nr:hypothetical protein D9758_001888 [Tetrapyrgos nigripes]
MPSSSSSDKSRRFNERPTLPPIRDLFADQLSNPSQRSYGSPPLSLATLRVRDDDDVPASRYSSSGHRSSGISSGPSTSYESTSSRPSGYYDPTNYSSRYSTDMYNSRSGSTSLQSSRSNPITSRHPEYHYDSAERTPVAHHPPPSVLYNSRDPRSQYGFSNPPLPISTSFDYSHRRRDEVEQTPIVSYGQSSVPRAPQTAPGPAKYECSYCKKGFNRPSSLKIHLNSHTGERPFVCPVEGCGRSFSVLSNMRRHARVHTQGASPSRQHELSGDEETERTSQSSTSSIARALGAVTVSPPIQKANPNTRAQKSDLVRIADNDSCTRTLRLAMTQTLILPFHHDTLFISTCILDSQGQTYLLSFMARIIIYFIEIRLFTDFGTVT